MGTADAVAATIRELRESLQARASYQREDLSQYAGDDEDLDEESGEEEDGDRDQDEMAADD